MRIEIGAHSGANQSKKCTSLAPSMKRNSVCVSSADGRQVRMLDNRRYVLLWVAHFTFEIYFIIKIARNLS